MRFIILFLSAFLSFNFFSEVKAQSWSQTIKAVSSSVVNLKIDNVRSFDTNKNSSTLATGFVVDAERGIIMTNRHVMQPGPATAEAIFQNHEEVTLSPIYCDPVHDFGFYRFDPRHLKYIQPVSLHLMPEKAQVGLEIKLIGNNSGEQLSILSGTLAKLDRNPPNYGFARYNDFNTFYYQSASGVSGGSSGSPVFNIEGDVIAINAGHNRKSSSSFFLSLERAKRALQLIQKNQMVTRGTLQTTFIYKPYNELKRLGLDAAIEKQLRAFKTGYGALVVKQVLPAYRNWLKPGDILLKINAQWITTYAALEDVLDSHVQQTIHLEIHRHNKRINLEVKVGDLHAITPSSFVHISGAVLHHLSYQQARHLSRRIQGVYVADSGYMFGAVNLPRGSVIEQINDKPIDDMASFLAVLQKIPDQQVFVIHYFTFGEPHRQQVAVVTMDRQWFVAEYCQRDDTTGLWPCQDLPEADQKQSNVVASRIVPSHHDDPVVKKLARSMVHIDFNMPYRIDGIYDLNYVGMGLIVDAEKGLVVTDRNTVPVAMGDVRLTFSDSVEIPAKTIFVHPLHNLTLLQYDPALIERQYVTSAVLSEQRLKAGDETTLIGFKRNQTIFSQALVVDSNDAIVLPLPKNPVFRETNLDVIRLINPPVAYGGVLTDKRGGVIALWSSFAYQEDGKQYQVDQGLPITLVAELKQQWVQSQVFKISSLDVELKMTTYAKARKLGLPDEWVQQLNQLPYHQRHVLTVTRKMSASNAAKQFKNGDIILAINQQPVNRFRAIEVLVKQDKVIVTLIRDAKVMEVGVEPSHYQGEATRKIMVWSGMIIQDTFLDLKYNRRLKHPGVYVNYVWQGSPASKNRLSSKMIITAVDNVATPDLKTFFALISKKQSQDSIKLDVMDKRDRLRVYTLKQDLMYWPTQQVFWKNGYWVHQRQ